MLAQVKIHNLFIVCLLVCSLLRATEPAPADPSSTERAERWDRNVDQAALAAQRKSIAKYAALVKKYAKQEQERGLQLRLLEAMEAAANLEFRIALGEAHIQRKPVDYRKYEATLRDVVGIASILIRATPDADDVIRIYFVRAQALAELKDIPRAKDDYKFIAVHFSGTPWAIRSNLTLAGYATESGNHQLAIDHLKKVEEFPEDKHYPFALYQLAWSYFNLNDNPTAISYAKRHIIYYKEKREQAPDHVLSISEKTYLEHSLKDVVTFYFEGFMKKLPGYALSDMLSIFRKIESGPELGKMLVQFANLLRTRDMVDDLSTWKTKIIEDESDRPEAIDVVIVNLDSVFIRRSFDRLVPAANGFKELDKKSDQKMRKTESYGKAQDLILQIASALHKAIADTKDRENSIKLSRILAGMYESFTAIVNETDPRLAQVHYNLAETFFNIKEFDDATNEYVWVLKHWPKKTTLNHADTSLKAISSRYQSLDKRQLLPKDLKPGKLSTEEKVALDGLQPLVREWVGWIDQYLLEFGRKPKAFEQFEFEADRVLYANGQTRSAIARMLLLVKDRSESTVATGAASLILDSYVFDTQWQLLLDVSELFLTMPKLGDAAFKKRLQALPADASFKLLEASYQAKDYPKTLEQVKRFEQRYPTSPQHPDCLFIASRAADQLHDRDASLRYLSQLLTHYPKTDKRSVALLARASLEDSAFDFDAAARDYAEYLQTTKDVKDGASLTKRLFFVTWLSKHPEEPKCASFGASPELKAECDRYRALIALARGIILLDYDELVDKALSGEKQNRTLWSAVALSHAPKTVGYRDRLTMAQSFASGAQDQDPLIQFVLIPLLNRWLPEAFSTSRNTLPRIASLKSSTSALARRIELMKALENSAAKVLALPWARVKISVLSEVAQAYEDFCDELAKLNAPDNLTPEELAEYKKGLKEILGPFREKGKTIRAQVAELAAEFPVQPEMIAGAVAPAHRTPASKTEHIDFALLTNAVGAPTGDLYPRWEEALKAQAWARAGFFFQQIKDKGGVPESSLSLMRAIALAYSGAEPEAIAELESVLKHLDPKGQAVVRRVLHAKFLSSTAAKKAQKYIEIVEPPPTKQGTPKEGTAKEATSKEPSK